ncbi:homoserine dehydrogenase [uncultured Clostridium sp.]|uniref:homoserine dehydrogenase n=1 Tax=uncultured Clostridium sp. TaxID=59620 RepID=UPI002638E314|nr:homoserine dehydrogenase [uncultured Clostridium sp.]
MKKVKIALLGLGNVGRGVWMILNSNRDEIVKRSGYDIEVAKVLVRDKEKDRGVHINKDLLTTNFNEILEDESIKIVIEVMGGVSPAKDYLIKCIERKKHIVTANKMLIATEGDELFKKADEMGTMFQYEASVAGGIPIIQGINESLTANKVEEMYGIINGTTNYILTKMEVEGLDFNTALKEAQEKGYAEEDPTSDIEGYDAKYKIAILSSLAFGTKVDIENVYREGISNIKPIDMEYAKGFNMVIKLLAIVKDKKGKLELRVHPAMIPKNHPLANVYDSFNAVLIKGNAVGDLMFYGRGAGDLPTGSAVVSDMITILKNNIDIDNLNLVVKNNLWKKRFRDMRGVESKYYIRMRVYDESGVLGRITTIFGDSSVSLRSVIQKGEEADGAVTLVLVTHYTKESQIIEAIDEIYELNSVKKIDNIIRIEDFK